MEYSCIVPFFNEAGRLNSVLRAVSQSKRIAEIICVDDGSTDSSAKIVEKFSRAKLICHHRNRGKTAAILSGLGFCMQKNLILLDSDLIDLKTEEIDKALYFYEQNQLDCLLLNTAATDFIDQLIRRLLPFPRLIAGNRIIKTKLLQEGMKAYSGTGYQLEVSQNEYLRKSGKRIAYFDISAKGTSKIGKLGLSRGVLAEIRMWRQILAYAGLLTLIKQARALLQNR